MMPNERSALRVTFYFKKTRMVIFLNVTQNVPHSVGKVMTIAFIGMLFVALRQIFGSQ